ncbi:MAG: hypothetical protein WCT14_07290 [Treponemataceae bacterium]
MKRTLLISLAFSIVTSIAFAQVPALTSAQKAKVDSLLKDYSALGSDPAIVKAVKDFNAAPPAETKGMTQEKWASLSVLSPEVKFVSKNALAEYLKAKRTPVMAELFVSGSAGTKAAFFAKTTSWSHKGKPKHDVPMTGKSWTGSPELDESSGKITVQFAFPVLDGKKPIGSVVIGLDVSKL